MTITVGRLVTIAATLAAAVAAWFFLAPAPLGGRTTYVATDGVSMLPRFHTGDLVLVRARPSYRVGEVVAYRSRTLDTIVLHRIVARRGDRFTFKGDHNDFLDPERPLRSQLVGALWVHVPRAAAVLQRLRNPFALGGLAGLGVLLAAGAGTRRRRRRRAGEVPVSPRWRASQRFVRVTGALLAAAVVSLLAFGALTALAYTRPATRTAKLSLPYRQAGSFTYAGRARRSVVYPSGRVHTGDPVFLRQVAELDVRFRYRFSSRTPHRVRGTISLAARVASSSGWTRSIPLGGRVPFAGDEGAAAGVLRLGRLPSLLARVESATDVGGASYTLTLVAHADVGGRVGGVPVAAELSPTLPFALDPRQLRPTPGPGGGASATGSVAVAREPTARLELAGRGLTVAAARRLGLVGMLAALGVVVAFAAAVLAGLRRRDEDARIAARYGPLLVAAEHVERPDGGTVVEVADFEVLVRLAERYERMIVHEPRERGRLYEVAEADSRYVYATGAPARAPRPTLVLRAPGEDVAA